MQLKRLQMLATLAVAHWRTQQPSSPSRSSSKGGNASTSRIKTSNCGALQLHVSATPEPKGLAGPAKLAQSGLILLFLQQILYFSLTKISTNSSFRETNFPGLSGTLLYHCKSHF